MNVDPLDEDWELSPEAAHPNAAKLLREPFYWDICDESSPFGNDSGADALELYRAGMESDPDANGMEFLAGLFEEWDIDQEFAEGVPDEELAHRLEREHSHILTYDDVVVATAFAELVFHGNTSSEVAAAAIKSLERQCLPEVLEFRGWSDPAERVARCREMIAVLQAAA